MRGSVSRPSALRRWLRKVFDTRARGVKLLLHDEEECVLLIRER